MYKMTSILLLKKIYSRTNLMSTKLQIVRICSGQKTISKKKKLEVPEEVLFFDFLKYRKNQAYRSIVIKLKTYSDLAKLQNLCSVYGKNFNMFNYKINSTHFALVEFQNVQELKSLLNDSDSDNSDNLMHIEGKEFMVFEKVKSVNKIFKNNCSGNIINASIKKSLNVNEELLNLSKNTTDNQFFMLYNNFKLNELEIRLRFITCRQIESIIQGLMPNAMVYPFGSSVSGLGLSGCDLDLVILKENSTKTIVCEDSKNNSELNRQKLQSHLNVLSEILNMFGKGCSNIIFIKNARVPIVKYKNEYTGVECDLSLYHNSGLKMTQILYIFLNLDQRVKPLINFIRLWAKSLNLISPKNQPNLSISNFCITILVIFFLQQSSNTYSAILPPFSYFSNEGKSNFMSNEDIALAIESSKLKIELNKSSLINLLYLYFKFYSNFDFANYGCCLKSGQIVMKTNKFSPVFIKNPFEPDSNISQNISAKALRNFQICASIACQTIKEKYHLIEENETILSIICDIKFYNKVMSHENNVSASISVKDFFC